MKDPGKNSIKADRCRFDVADFVDESGITIQLKTLRDYKRFVRVRCGRETNYKVIVTI